MQAASKSKLSELQTIITKMPVEVCCVTALPEFGVRWREVCKAVRNSRLPMVPASVARVLARHAARSLTGDEVDEIVAKLRLKLIATQERKWHVINLKEPTNEEISIAHLIRAMPSRVAQELRRSRAGRNMSPEVQTVMLGDLVYLSVQMVSETKHGAVLYIATPPGEPVALVSSIGSSMLKACVLGLGYKSFEDAKLFGRDIKSLLRIHNGASNDNVDHLACVPEYAPMPVITKTGIDYTHKAYDEQYIDNILGPDPPLLNELILTSSKSFFDPSRINKTMSIRIAVKSEDVSKSLKAWVSNNAVPPTSEFFLIFHNIKSNQVECGED